MSKATDPAMFESGFERLAGDKYYTEAWLTEILLRRLSVRGLRVWEPACGRGDMARVLEQHGADIVCSDIAPEFDGAETFDFIAQDGMSAGPVEIDAIITNPPYFKHNGKSMAERFTRAALAYGCRYVAMLTRSEFNTSKGRRDLFRSPHFAFEIVICERPRWDWWFRDKPENGPRHSFSWFVWDRVRDPLRPSTQFFETRSGK